jgi:Ca2+-binding RTX toxin-like protein
MLGLLGLMGALMAGFMVDALMAQDPDEATPHDEDAVPPDETGQEPSGLEDLMAAAAPPDADQGADEGLPHSDDEPDLHEDAVTLTGDTRDDILTGEGGNDLIQGNAGNDLLGGRSGDDQVLGGAGQDWVHGGEGVDSLYGGQGGDDLQGEAGRDLLAGGAGGDSMAGGEGSDRLMAGAGEDRLLGGRGNDALSGGTGADELQGGLGADRVWGGTGSDVVDGNEGDDTLWGGGLGGEDGAVDFVNGGAGADVLHLGAGDYGSGGLGQDAFELDDIAPGDPLAQITDYDPVEDRLVVLYDAAHHTAPEISVVTEEGSGDATVLLDGVPVAQVLGGAGLLPSDVTLQAA